MEMGPDRWFNLSRRELKVLLISSFILLASVTGLQMMRQITWRDEFEVEGVVEAFEPPERLNVNTARPYELESLPGIGEKTADAIVRYREENGSFRSLDDLVKIPGIGHKTVRALRPLVMCIQPEDTELKSRKGHD
jgi:comEA protein